MVNRSGRKLGIVCTAYFDAPDGYEEEDAGRIECICLFFVNSRGNMIIGKSVLTMVLSLERTIFETGGLGSANG